MIGNFAEISKVSFALYYKLEKEEGDKLLPAAIARTGMVCYNSETKKMAAFPAFFHRSLVDCQP